MISPPEIIHDEQKVPADAPVVDAFTSAIRELFFIMHPQWRSGSSEAEKAYVSFRESPGIAPVWIRYPWRAEWVKTVEESTYLLLRTARNRNVITAEEQLRYRSLSVGIAGLSVGSAVVQALVMSGGPQRLRIADFDIVEITNLNRLRAKLPDVGMEKSAVTAREIWELDPFAQIDLWEKGITKDTLDTFLLRDPKLDVMIDAMDNLDLKIRLRFAARKARVPVLMATDNGDSVILDVERFDEEPDAPLFHGRVPELESMDLDTLTFPQWVALATKIVGEEFLEERMKLSVTLVGKELAAIPQLGPTAAMGGMAIAYTVRKIANGAKVPSGRYFVGLKGDVNGGMF